jgi:hypothetical protein
MSFPGKGIDPHKLPKFSSIIDGNMSKAIEIVTYYRNSIGFTLPEWEGQEFFYLSCLEKFEDFIQLLDKDSSESGINYDRNLINSIREAINQLIDDRKLSYSMMLVVYITIAKELDYVRSSENTYSEGELNNIFLKHSPNILNDLIRLGIEKKEYVPMVSTTGLYGYNTFLYLYYNGLSPIGFGYFPVKAHNGTFLSLIDQIHHDLAHMDVIVAAQAPSLKSKYLSIFDNFERLGDDNAKICIFVIFICLHEGIWKPEFLQQAISLKIQCDIFHIFDEVPGYRIEDFGYLDAVKNNPRNDRGKHDCYELMEAYSEKSMVDGSHCNSTTTQIAVLGIDMEFTFVHKDTFNHYIFKACEKAIDTYYKL